MNINVFFLIVSLGLMMIFFLFKPLDIKKQKFIDVPLFELSSFTLFELNNEGLSTIMKGLKAIRFNNRYEVENLNYTDNSKVYIANMSANNGLYKDDVISLRGDVTYSREDGLVFQTQEATYNKKTKIAFTDKDFIAYRGTDKITGSSLVYNNSLNTTKSKNVIAQYTLEEK
ncbi:LPS export ABC transporter periplasmic protein LptC [bacterium]|nr:LPS export ABC transporter periplasmic protein LptC [bacterium]MBU1995468.1 LPS export ABC transporter periplasmic protein LptC [bacterium]